MIEPPHPEPPENFNEWQLPLIESSGVWFRIYRSSYNPIYFSRIRPDSFPNRFDDPLGEYGVLYCGNDIYAAVIETLAWSTGTRFISRSLLVERRLLEITSNTNLTFVDLTGPGLTQIGADARLCVGTDRHLSQTWSRILWEHPAQPDGIRYISRHDPQRICYGIFDRPNIENIFCLNELGSLNDRNLSKILGEIFDHYKFSLVN